jgi:hypothetical protein
MGLWDLFCLGLVIAPGSRRSRPVLWVHNRL